MSYSVTIIDDCHELCVLITCLLKEELDVTCSTYGSLTEVEEHSGEVLSSKVAILDINLGQGQPDGVEVYHWLRNHHYQGKVFFFTGHALASPQVMRAAETGVPVLEKPMSVEEIVSLLVAPLKEVEPLCHEN